MNVTTTYREGIEELDDRVGFAFDRFNATADPLWYGGRVVYQRALPFVRGRAVIDVGCGIGAGTAYLGTAASRIVGLDKNPRAIAFAQAMNPMLQWRMWDIAAFPFVEFTAEVVTCVECLEHIADSVGALRNMLRMSPTVVLSTPNLDGPLCNRRGPQTIGHVREYSVTDLQALANSAGGFIHQLDLLGDGRSIFAVIRRILQ
jgi:2-polyprenyl-3-methyl-5-hydroxy-6-metoxy-1,4-benzoquinol methylase